ncbi:MAG: MarR family winged helix-turn-helix transcriptional regulator [Candidatus Velamenicoccus archaeovorus]
MTQESLREFTRQMSQLMPTIMRGILKRHADEVTSGEITISQYLVMEMLRRKGAMKMTQIALEMGITLPAATGLIDRLHGTKILDRLYDQDDRRVVRIHLTPKGRRLFLQLSRKREKMVKHIFGKISEEERQTYLKILRKIRDVIYEKP